MSTWTIDASHSSITFSVRHLMISNVKGEFQKVSGTVTWDKANPGASSVEVEIDMNSINTREDKRDAHLKSADFFDTEKFPTMTFRATSVKAKGDGAELTGDLTLRGVTRSVTLEVDGPTPEQKDPWGNTRVGASASAKIKRSDFGVTWNAALETGGVVVGDEVKIHVDVSLVKQG